jgi:methyltransferase (TIGR00027 family)
MTVIAFAIYIVLQIALLPLAIIGGLWVAYKQIRVSQRLGLSQTAVEIINGRWTMDVFGLREDTAARKLARKMPNDSIFGLWMALFPLYLLYRMTGKNYIYPRVAKEGHENFSDLVPARTPVFDSYINAHAGNARQLVFMGAGLDTRAYGPLKERDLSIFELDQATTQQMKRKALKRARIKSDHVQFLEVDFTDSSWPEGLLNAGFDRKAKTIFVWEGVTLYLSDADVRSTISTVQGFAGPDSVLILDIYSRRLVTLGNRAKKILDATGEGLEFGMEFEENHDANLQQFAQSLDVELSQHRFLGAATKNGPFAVIAELLL